MILNDDDDDNNKDLLKVGKIYLMRKCTRTKRKFDQNPLCMQIKKKNYTCSKYIKEGIVSNLKS